MPEPGVESWLEKAAEDEQAVEALVTAKVWGPAAYHVQQAAEKFIKAAVVAVGKSPPKSHDLAHLVALVGHDIEETIERAANLTSVYSWLTRYPGAPPIDEHHVDDARGHLAVIKAWCLEVIANP